ncbi:GntR family transcriptional regulator [Pseudoroseomonas rhizosphaerae]|uniref:GntR family transcriptional regulator n=1 Tax=Teichococcus rhizosphaerae TaxID=1335062 RepID=A0A2C7ADN5_9PROT|nr:GntR family transcriptional regulator [Pseudoroseomonas rhizosphaerae]PHK95194.1 GntR family transcriptional regulator [Pseudoroseomonas rhizosphaerae]
MRLPPAPPLDIRPDAGGLATLAPMGRRRSAAESAYESLRAAVISLALPPGTAISRAAVAARLGVSQTPVREALIRLQEEGLIAVVPQSATRVARIDTASAREASFLRQAVELAVVRRLAEAPPPGLEEALRAELARMRASGDEDGFTAADEAFHGVLCAAAGVPGLHELVRSRSGHLDRLRRLHLPSPGKAEAVLRQHEELAAAILRRDPAEAERLLRDHLSNTFAELARIRERFPDYF